MQSNEHHTEHTEAPLLAQLREQVAAQLRCLNEPGAGDKIDAFMDPTKAGPRVVAGSTY